MANDTSNIDLSELFYYDESSPSCLRWKVSVSYKIKKDAVAGYRTEKGYWRVGYKGTYYRCHRIVYELAHGNLDPSDQVDHIDGMRDNNRIGNLRKTDVHGNARNQKKFSTNKTGATGVSERHYFNAAWIALDGTPVSKNFSVAKLGREEAFRQAVEAREQAIAEMNLAGAGYSATHGERL